MHNPKSVEFHQSHAKRHSICFYHNIKDNERNHYQDLLTTENSDSDLKVRAALCKRATCTTSEAAPQTFFSKPFANSLKMQKQYEKLFGKRVMTRIRCR